ncbi:Ssy5p [Lachancea thermotolerans CBS 6340]|uniref:SPS-sensor serine protease component SSY5 n=1 Tax=Lachancea thermotolerans (strain ATCC 56472 / CBS 6340 / NRRL Y-8284) TaxID=559295 RepID=C5DKJ0_LACTC|nr:KLTH0F05104p [Lachancea thermotolerans CBS 6340]CAR23991.1 KLTH0F05104p [Lachancea thermotolerans CBS 6340]
MAKKLFGIGRKKTEAKDTKSGDASPSSTAPSSCIDEDVMDTTGSSKFDDSSSRVTSSIQSSSIFSKGRLTHGTGASSTLTGGSQDKKSGDTSNVGKPLRVLDFGRGTSLNPVFEEEDSTGLNSIDEHSSRPSKSSQRSGTSLNKEKTMITAAQLDRELKQLDENLAGLMDDIHQNVTNISKAVIQAVEYFKEFLPDTLSPKVPFRVSVSKSGYLRRITKVVLHFVDNLLVSDVFNNSRAIITKRFITFLKKLNISTTEDNIENHALPHARNFCIGADCELPNKGKLSLIIDKIAAKDSACISDQEGAFIAPILRGISKGSAVLTVMFGLPDPQQEHYDMIKALYSLFPDIHFYCVKNYITPCAEVAIPPSLTPQPMESKTTTSFHPPYRLLPDANSPPISMSLSSHENKKISGTLGGYIYPQIDENNAALSQFAGSTFAITCAHVALAESQDYPYVSVPSTVLQNQYKKAIIDESQRYAKDSPERAAFEEELIRIDQNLKWQDENKFGQVVWGERAVVNSKLSDFAIIKTNSELNCTNFLGDDVATMAGPFLRFQNLYVKDKVLKLKPGSEVFKIGATTKYTSGQFSGSKLVYWADGKIQSSEFVVASPNPLFASGGDSGAWILTKLTGKLGLGVVGMLHSYDGEQRQFGLFSPIGDIFQRLNQVTGVTWDICRPPNAK